MKSLLIEKSSKIGHLQTVQLLICTMDVSEDVLLTFFPELEDSYNCFNDLCQYSMAEL
jgi:hypothetical protein